MVRLSEEQQLFIEKALQGNNILVDACIGSGKTTSIQVLCDKYPLNKKILYLTYNKLLKIDARSKINRKGVTVTNYHGFAYMCLARQGVRSGISDLIQNFIKHKPVIPYYDVLLIDEYQDIEQELATMLEMIKAVNPNMQIIAVGDMQQKIYDKTTLDVASFINNFLDDYIELKFTQCFRISRDHAEKLGRIWEKQIIGVNPNCKISQMSKTAIVDFLARQNPEDILCLGARTGDLANTLNTLESEYPNKFNKRTVYASIRDNDSSGASEPTAQSAIFTTYDSSKGLERKICVIFDFTESYWMVRIRKPEQSYEILRNIFLVAASRGKEQIIFVTSPTQSLLSEYTLSRKSGKNHKFEDMDISDMFDSKYKEDIEECFSLLDCKKVYRDDMTSINVKRTDELIDLSPCIGNYQEVSFFNGSDIDKRIEFKTSFKKDGELYPEEIRSSSLEKKILFYTSLETKQNRYVKQVNIPFITDDEKVRIHERLGSVFDKDDDVQVECKIPFAKKAKGETSFTAKGMIDVVKDNVIYELKFVSELTHEHFLQCACYMVATGIKKGILWNTLDNEMYEICIPDRKKFLDAVAKTVTKGEIKKYYKPK